MYNIYLHKVCTHFVRVVWRDDMLYYKAEFYLMWLHYNSVLFSVGNQFSLNISAGSSSTSNLDILFIRTYFTFPIWIALWLTNNLQDCDHETFVMPGETFWETQTSGWSLTKWIKLICWKNSVDEWTIPLDLFSSAANLHALHMWEV